MFCRFRYVICFTALFLISCSKKENTTVSETGNKHRHIETIENDGNTTEAEIFGPATERADPAPQATIGDYYELRQDVPQTDEGVGWWYRQAAAQGDHKANAALKKLYAKNKAAQEKGTAADMFLGGRGLQRPEITHASAIDATVSDTSVPNTTDNSTSKTTGPSTAAAKVKDKGPKPPCEPQIHPYTKGYQMSLILFQDTTQQPPADILQRVSNSLFIDIAMVEDNCYRMEDHFADFYEGVKQAYIDLY